MQVNSMSESLVQREALVDEALRYCRAGYSVIPVGRDKKPKIPWEQYQKRCATEDEVATWWENFPYANVGLVTGSVSGFCVVDADGSIGVESLRTYIPEGTVQCSTPSGGCHYYFSCPNDSIANAARFLPSVDFRGNGGYVVAPPSVGSNGNKYVWKLGGSIFELDLTEMPHDLMDVLNSQRLYAPAKSTKTITSDMFSSGRRDVDLFTTANFLIKSGMGNAQVEEVVLRLAATCDPPFSQEEAVRKVESAMKRALVRERNLMQEVTDYIASTEGTFNVKDIYNFLGINIKADKFKVSRVLKELESKKFIERAGTGRDGLWRRLIIEEELIDFVGVESQFVNLKWPFHIEEYVQLMPKNIAVVAGTPNSGKTAFMLNLVRYNMDKFDITYFSSEMGASEFKTRLSKFDIPLESWRFTAIERSGDFADVIRPNGVNIIDFLEVHDEFFKVGGYMKQIYDKLEKGVAIIALQRNKDNPTGLGGYRSLEKPRLYLNLSADSVDIIKAKNWQKEAINPNGLRCKFTLKDGWQFDMQDGWYRV
jgi:hypothetical protein